MVDVTPAPGPVGFFCQSGPLSLTSVRMLVDRGLGVSSFVSAGNRADVSGNDLLQYWDEDEQTDVILSYLESLGNAEKFSRIARRISRHKPIVVLTSGRGGFSLGLRPEELGDEAGALVPAAALEVAVANTAAASAAVVDAMFRQAGVIRVDHIEHLFDVAQVLVRQPLPRGNRLAIVGDSPELTIIAADVATHAGFKTHASWLGLAALTPEAYAEKLEAAMADESIDAVLAVFVPAPAETEVDWGDIRKVIAEHGRQPHKPLLAVISGGECDQNLFLPAPEAQADSPLHRYDGTVPIYPGPERAILALNKAWKYAQWRAHADKKLPLLHDVDPTEATTLIRGVLADAPAGRPLTDEEAIALLAHYGVPVLPYRRAVKLEEAVAAAEELGWDVAVKVTNATFGDASDQRVWARIRDENELTVAWRQLTQAFGDPAVARVVVQGMGRAGLHAQIKACEDPQLGPVLSFRLAGAASRILHDSSYRLTPLSHEDAAEMVREIRLAPMLIGDPGFPPRDVAAVEDLLIRVAQLKENQPDVDRLDVQVLAHDDGLSVLGARAWTRRHALRPYLYARRLSSSPDGM